MEEPLWANTGCVMKCLIKCLFKMLPLFSTDERLLSQHLLFVIVRASSVNPINRVEKRTCGQLYSLMPSHGVVILLFKCTGPLKHLS